MYPNLEAELKRKNIKRSDLANFLGISLSTMSEKMQGNSDFTFAAAKKIKDFLRVDIPLEVLFANDSATEQSLIGISK